MLSPPTARHLTRHSSIACQLMDALHPNVVPLKKVDFNARSEYDMVRPD